MLELLGALNNFDDFDCYKQVLNGWLVRHTRQAQASESTEPFVVVENDRVVGYSLA
jgi:hypothetical protein